MKRCLVAWIAILISTNTYALMCNKVVIRKEMTTSQVQRFCGKPQDIKYSTKVKKVNFLLKIKQKHQHWMYRAGKKQWIIHFIDKKVNEIKKSHR